MSPPMASIIVETLSAAISRHVVSTSRSGPGFLLDHRGAFSNISYPPTGHRTSAFAINARGDIVGFYLTDDPSTRGPFLRDKDGVFTLFDTPWGVGATGINTRREMVGYYDGRSPEWVMAQLPQRPIWKPDSGRGPWRINTRANGINDRGDIVGTYYRCGRWTRIRVAPRQRRSR